MHARFKNQIFVVTGGFGGLGRAIAKAFVAEGARVVAADLAPPSSEDLEVAERRNVYQALDVTDEAAWVRMFAALWGAPDVLVNNAGFYRPNVPFEETPLDLWRKHMAINATACSSVANAPFCA